MSAGAKRMTTEQATQAQQRPSNRPQALDTEYGITRAGWLETTTRAKQRRNRPLVNLDQGDQSTAHDFAERAPRPRWIQAGLCHLATTPPAEHGHRDSALPPCL